MTEKILLACTGGSTGPEFKACGLVGDGFPCVPLAATPGLLSVIESVGTDNFEETWDHACPSALPPTGGLWVLECELEDDDDGDVSDEDEGQLEVGRHLRPTLWREPTACELAALLARQRVRAAGEKPESLPVEELCVQEADAEWVFAGALV